MQNLLLAQSKYKNRQNRALLPFISRTFPQTSCNVDIAFPSLNTRVDNARNLRTGKTFKPLEWRKHELKCGCWQPIINKGSQLPKILTLAFVFIFAPVYSAEQPFG